MVTELEKEHGVISGAVLKNAFSDKLLLPAITGKISDEEWRKNISDTIDDKVGLVSRWSESVGAVNTSCESFLRSIKDKVTIVLVSNATSRLNSDLGRLGIADLFDYVVNSSKVGHAKPNIDIYEYALGIGNWEPADVLFVDDQIENVQAAEKMGIESHQFTGTENMITFINEHLC